MTRLMAILLIPLALKSSGQITINERKFSMSLRNENACNSGSYNFRIPYLATTTQDDIRSLINDSLSKIAKTIIDTGNGLTDFDYYGGECDSSELDFDPEEHSMEYKVWRNSERVLSLYVSVGWGAGGGGSGFSSTDHFFNVDHFNNEMITLDSLFNPKNKIALQRWVGRNLDRLVKEQGYTELITDSIDIFGPAAEDFGYSYVGFNIDSTSLVLTYSRDMGRGNYSFHFKLPLKEIISFINKKYSWLYSLGTKK